MFIRQKSGQVVLVFVNPVFVPQFATTTGVPAALLTAVTLTKSLYSPLK